MRKRRVQTREARQGYALRCGIARRAELIVAEAAETAGADQFEVTFRRTGQP